MSGWTDVEAPNAPEGLGDPSSPTVDHAIRIDETTGDVPVGEGGEAYGLIEDVPINQDSPIAVVLVADEATRVRPHYLWVTGQTFLPDSVDAVQIIGRSSRRKSITFKIASPGNGNVYIAPQQDSIERLGFLLLDSDGLDIDSGQEVWAKAVGADATIYWSSEEEAKV